MDFLGITSSEAIRGTLGVKAKELPDSVFTDTQFATELQYDIEVWLPETIAVIIAKEAVPTAGYDTKLGLLMLHAQYRGATIISPHARLGFAQALSDGQNEFSRNIGALDKLLGEIASRENKYKDDLLLDYEETLASRTTLFGSAAPNYDPVTDETA